MSDVTTGVIHDIGYQRYRGARLSRAYIVGSLYTHGLRTAFGLGRSAKAKIFPWFAVGVVGVVAVVLTAVRAQIDQVVLSYAEFPEVLTLLIIFFCAVVAPELVSRDLRTGVLPLYFSRPLRRTDYALAKFAALVSAVFLLLAGPQFIMFLGAAFDRGSLGGAWDEFQDLAPGVAHSAVHALVYGSLAIYVASLVSRRAIAAGAIAGVFLVTTPVVGVLAVMPSTTANQLAGLASPVTLVGGVGDWLFEKTGSDYGVGDWGPLYGATAAGFVVLLVALLLLRYRKVAS
ncbi:MAG TPA: ABC transporter permease [Pilimelia sp.]|nr:ABC transporter permease [Pilimelia sp.]